MKLTGKSLKNLIKEVLDEEKSALQKFKDGEITYDEWQATLWPSKDTVMSPEEQAAQAEKYPPRAMDPEVDRAKHYARKQALKQQQALAQQAREEDDDRFKNPDEPYSIADLRPNMSEDLMYEGDDSILEMFEDATLEEGGLACPGCLFEMLQEASCGCPDLMGEAVYQGKTVQLNKPTRGDVKKFKVYVNSGKKDAKGRVKAKKVNFGDKKMKIKKSNPKRRKSFRARHKCHTAKDKKTARYWSCKKW